MSEIRSNLIIMPGSPEANEIPEIRTNYTGRTLTLNVGKTKVWQTIGFYLGPNRMFGEVPANADQQQIQTAVLNGTLIDVTDSAKAGVQVGGDGFSAISTVDDPNLRRVFIGSKPRLPGEAPASGTRELYIAIPEDEEQEAEFLHQIQTRGRIDGSFAPLTQPSGLSPITVSDLPQRPPIQSRNRKGFRMLREALRQIFREIFPRRSTK